MTTTIAPVAPLEIFRPMRSEFDRVLTPDALEFVGELVSTFRIQIDELLARRAEAQARFDAGERPGFLPKTTFIRTGNWTAPIGSLLGVSATPCKPTPHETKCREDVRG